MPKPANVMTSTESPYASMGHAALLKEANERGLELKKGYVPAPDLRKALEADDDKPWPAKKNAKEEGAVVEHQIAEPGKDLEATADFIPADQPAHRQDANKPVPSRVPADAVMLDRAHLVSMAKGEVVEIGGVKLAAGNDFPPLWKLQA